MLERHNNHNSRKEINMFKKISTLMILCAVIFTQWSGAVRSVKAAQCSAAQGQLFIESGQYNKAVQEFTCIIDSQPTEVEGYRGRIEAQLLLGQYSNALGDYARITAVVVPVHPDAGSTIVAGYATRLAVTPNDIIALTGKSFAHWALYDYAPAIHVLNHLLEVQPNSAYGNLFRGSSRLLQGQGANKAKGMADLEYAIALAPQSPDVRFVVADAYTYGVPDLQRAFSEASLALSWGLNTPRIHAILATAYESFGNPAAAAAEIKTHIDLVTTEFVTTSSMAANTSLTLSLVPGRTYSIPVSVTAGQTLSIATSSRDFWDTIMVLIGPDGTPVIGSDDANAYFAAFDWVAPASGTYVLQVTSFESINTGELVVTRN